MQIMVAASPVPEHLTAAAAVQMFSAVVTIAALHYWKWIKPFGLVAAARHTSGCVSSAACPLQHDAEAAIITVMLSTNYSGRDCLFSCWVEITDARPA